MTRRLLFGFLAAWLALGAAQAVVRRRTRPTRRAASTASATDRWMRTMTLRDEVAQLIFVPFPGPFSRSQWRESRKFQRLIRQTHVGGLILVNQVGRRLTPKPEARSLAAFLNRMQRQSRIPLLVGADFERGASMRVGGAAPFPHAMAFGAAGDPELARWEGQVTAREARAVGVQWLFFPVADVNNNADNPVINIRSFGENPQAVAAMVRAFIEGAHSDPKNYVLTTAKHFPGHGDTAEDTHLHLVTISADRERLDRLELVPFRAAIAAGVDAVMTAHVAVPALAPPSLPATLAPQILTDLLRKELGFQGLVITDALDMGGIANGFSSGDAAVRALQAGADALLMPADPEAALKAVLAAVADGRLTRRRIQESVRKILAAKQRLGLDRRRLVNLTALNGGLDTTQTDARVQEIADRAVTLVRNNDHLLPVTEPARACFLVLAESPRSTEGESFILEVRKQSREARVTMVNAAMTQDQLTGVVAELASCERYVVAAFATEAAFHGSVGLAGALPAFLQQLIATGKPVALVALGDPYLLRNFSGVAAYVATFSTVAPSEVAAARAIFGQIDIRGHLPVTIPGAAEYDEGIELPAIRPAPIVAQPQ